MANDDTLDKSTKKFIEDTVGKTVSKRLKKPKNADLVKAIETPPTLQKTQEQNQALLEEKQQNIKYRHIPMVGTSPGKTAEYVKGIINSLNAGVFYGNVSLFCDAVLEDEAVYSAFSVRLQSLVSSRIDIIPASEDPKALEVRDLCQKHLSYMISNQQITWLMRWGLLLSNGFASIYMDELDGYQIPRVQLWHPRYARWDMGTREYKMVTENMGEVFVLANDPSWMIVQPFGDFYPWFQAMVKPLSKIYLKRYWALEWWARHQEASGTPMYGAVVPPYTDPQDEDEFFRSIAEREFAPVVRLPQGKDGNKYQIEVIQAQSDLFMGFESMLKYCDSQIYRLINGQDFSMGATSSILSSAENPGKAVRQEIRRHDARTIEPVIYEKLLKPWCIANFGDVNLTPTVKFDIEDKEDQLTKSKSIQVLMDAFNKAGITNIPLDAKAILNDMDLPISDNLTQAAMGLDTSNAMPTEELNELDDDDEDEDMEDDEIEKLSSLEEVKKYLRKSRVSKK